MRPLQLSSFGTAFTFTMLDYAKMLRCHRFHRSFQLKIELIRMALSGACMSEEHQALWSKPGPELYRVGGRMN